MIYDLSSNKGNKKIITAERGKIISEEGSKYMTLVLYNGFYHEEYIPKRRSMNNIYKKTLFEHVAWREVRGKRNETHRQTQS